MAVKMKKNQQVQFCLHFVMMKIMANAFMQMIPIEIRAIFLLLNLKLFFGISDCSFTVVKRCSLSVSISGAIFRVTSGISSPPLDSRVGSLSLLKDSRGTNLF